MPAPVINVGTGPNTGTGDTLRDAFIKVNSVVTYAETAAELAADSAAAAAAAASSGFDAVFNGTLIIADATDKSAAIAAGVAIGKPLMFIGAAIVSSPVTITVPIIDTMAQIFAVDAQVTIDNGLATRPEWFGGSLDRMYASWPAAGGVGLLADKVYAPMTTQMTKGALIGTRKPRFKFSAGAYVGLEGGSIVQGPLAFRGNDISFSNFGVDSGSDVCAALYAGSQQEGFFSGLPVATRNERLNISDCVAICKAPASTVHAFCLEGYTNSEVHRLDAVYGVHGVALKMTNSNVSDLRARGCLSDGVIVKSDTATTTSERLNIDGIICASVGTYDGGGLRVTNTAGNQSLVGVNIKNVQLDRTIYGIDLECNDTHLLDSVSIDGFFAFVPQTYGFRNQGQARRCKVSNGMIYNPQGTGVITSKAVGSGSGDGVPEVDFTDVTVTNSATDGWSLYGRNRLTRCHSQVNGGWGFAAQAGSRVFRLACVSSNNTTGDYTGKFYPGETVVPGAALTLANSWTNFGAGKPEAAFTVTDDGTVRLSGLIASGTLGSHCAVLPVNFRPAGELRFCQPSSNGTVNGVTHVLVLPNGQIVPQAGGGNTFLSLDGIAFRADLT